LLSQHDEELDEADADEANETLMRLSQQPPCIKFGQMRAYQLEGLNWMLSLYARGLNGILADEMGLGKTLQTISLLGHISIELKQPAPHLVVLPLSVLGNWQAKLHTPILPMCHSPLFPCVTLFSPHVCHTAFSPTPHGAFFFSFFFFFFFLSDLSPHVLFPIRRAGGARPLVPGAPSGSPPRHQGDARIGHFGRARARQLRRVHHHVRDPRPGIDGAAQAPMGVSRSGRGA
jgi:hypothetical protein